MAGLPLSMAFFAPKDIAPVTQKAIGRAPHFSIHSLSDISRIV